MGILRATNRFVSRLYAHLSAETGNSVQDSRSDMLRIYVKDGQLSYEKIATGAHDQMYR